MLRRKILLPLFLLILALLGAGALPGLGPTAFANNPEDSHSVASEDTQDASDQVPTPVPQPEASPLARRAMQYIAAREEIPIDELALVNDFKRESPLLKRSFQAVTLIRTTSGQFFHLLVDSTTEVIEERQAIEQEERAAHVALYGNLHPDLYEYLRDLQESDQITVTIVPVPPPGLSFGEREAAVRVALAAKYPEARRAIEQGGRPTDGVDILQSEKIYQEYLAFIDETLPQRIQPIVQELRARGLQPRTFQGIPAVTASIPKRLIMMLSKRPDIGIIFPVIDTPLQLAMSTASKTDRAPVVWSRGYDGTGVKVAILEPGNIDFDDVHATSECPSGTNNCFSNPGTVRVQGVGFRSHKTAVASVAASNHSMYKGIAHEATINDATITGLGFEQDLVDALDWALNGNADVVNLSGGYCTSSNLLQFIDWAFDYYIKKKID